MSEEDRATAIGNTHYKFDEDRMCNSEDMIADRETHRQTDRHAHHITLQPYRGGVTSRPTIVYIGGAGSMKRSSVRLSVCPSVPSNDSSNGRQRVFC